MDEFIQQEQFLALALLYSFLVRSSLELFNSYHLSCSFITNVISFLLIVSFLLKDSSFAQILSAITITNMLIGVICEALKVGRLETYFEGHHSSGCCGKGGDSNHLGQRDLEEDDGSRLGRLKRS